ncbi:MAG: class I SAM-dependent methyltransferase family protein [Promethearchaeota archaeon]
MVPNLSGEIKYLKIKKAEGQKALSLISNNFRKYSVINQRYKILYDDKFIFFPLERNNDLIEKVIKFIENKIDSEIICKIGVINKNYKFKSLQDALKGKIPNLYQQLIPKSYDLIGNIAIIEFDEFENIKNKNLSYYKKEIAKAITIINKKIISVYEKKSRIMGTYRLRELDLLYGKDISETIYKENNCIYKLDVKKTYFTPRFGYEHRRVAFSDIKKNEQIVDMFAGVGSFSIQIGKNHKVKIYAFDVNPDAYNYLKENIKINKLKGEIIPYNLNAKDLLKSSNILGKSLQGKSDRILMNLPERSIDFVDVACFLMKKTGGLLHFYQFSKKPNPIGRTIELLNNKLNNLNWVIDKILLSKIVKSYSPKAELIVVDLLMRYSKF